ncbi:HYR domain-containing protein [uncultured Algibacter sp.]|uniref:HYR domain-containing protein n=1 Tax=uncultured Algibacter sp. TaxID=298659 RepID=UPI0026074DF3|nr:HYR domain-containing protein [uncultured Algibacter sp.]
MLKNYLNYLLLLSLSLLLNSCSSDGSNMEAEEKQKSEDKILPTIKCLDNINISADQFSNSITVDYETPVGTDNIEGAVTIQTEGLKSGSLFPIGNTTNTFEVKDASGNTASCSFDVEITQEVPLQSMPYFVNNNPTPTGKKWSKIEELSDEFNDTDFDDNKWHRNPASDPFRWYGRPPALFESDNVSVSNGNLNITVEKFDTPKNVNNTSWTHGGAILRSKTKAKYGQYYECRMKANKTVMSSTFWIAFPQNCNSGPIRKLELDIQECVGRTHDGTHSWAKKWDAIYHSNTWRHQRSCDTEVNESKQSPGKVNLDEKNNSRFFVYGCWWKSPTELLFYLDGEYVYTITPPTDFDIEGHITMAIETYDWNPIDVDNIFETGSKDDLTTKYDWVRTWKLEDI